MPHPTATPTSPAHPIPLHAYEPSASLQPCTDRLLEFADRLDAEGVPLLAAAVRRAAATPVRLPARCLRGI